MISGTRDCLKYAAEVIPFWIDPDKLNNNYYQTDYIQTSSKYQTNHIHLQSDGVENIC